MGEFFKLVAELGFPIAVAIAVGYFVFLTLKFILAGVTSSVKGMAQGVRIYTLAEETQLHKDFITLYYAGEWKKAQALIPGCRRACPTLEVYYGAMDERLATGKPSDWMGTYKATSK